MVKDFQKSDSVNDGTAGQFFLTDDYYFVTLTLDDQVNTPGGFGRGTLVANQKYISVAGGYLTGSDQGSIETGDTVILRGVMGKVSSAKATTGEYKGFEARMFKVELIKIIPQK